MTTSGSATPGWYPDPHDSTQYRYWDGSAWTESTMPAAGAGGSSPGADSGSGSGAPNPFAAPGGPPSAGASDPAGGSPFAAPGQPLGGADQGAGNPFGAGSPPEYGSGQPWSPGASPYGSAGQPLHGGGLSDIGSWLSGTFNTLVKRIVPVSVFLIVVPLIGWSLVLLLFRSAVESIVIDTRGDVEVTGFGAGGFLVTALVTLIVLLVVGTARLGTSHQLYMAHDDTPRSLGASWLIGLRRLPRAIGWGLILVIAVLAAVFVFVLVGVYVGVGAGLLTGLALFVVGVWLWVKLFFFETALVVAPPGVSPFQASWQATDGRWGAVFGRGLLIGVILSAISFGVQIVSGIVGAVLPAWHVNFDSNGNVLFNGINVEDSDVLEVGSLLPGAGATISLVVLYTVSQAVSRAIWLSANTGLYHQAGGAVDPQN